MGIIEKRTDVCVGVLAEYNMNICLIDIIMYGIHILFLPFTRIGQLSEGHAVGIDASCE